MIVLKAISRALAWIESFAIVSLLGLMVVLAFLQVVMRNVFSTGFFWADPFLRHLVLWIGFLGASLATREEKHINLDVVTRFTSARLANIIRVATNLFAGAITLFLARAGWTFLVSEMESAETLLTIGQLNAPAWWFQLIIPVGFALMSFRFFIRTIEHARESFQPAPHSSPPVNVPTIDS